MICGHDKVSGTVSLAPSHRNSPGDMLWPVSQKTSAEDSTLNTQNSVLVVLLMIGVFLLATRKRQR